MDIRFEIMTNIVERFLINNWMCLFIEHGDLMDVSNQNVLNQKRFKKVYISDVCCCKKKQLDGHHVDATYAFTKCAGYHQACAQCPVWLVISSVVKQLLYKFSIQDFFFQISFRYYSQAHYQIEWLFVSSLVYFTCNGINMICFQYRQTVDEYLAHSKYERAYLTWKCTFIYVRMEFGWHARKCFDVVISLTLFFLSHSIHCIHERPISIDRKKNCQIWTVFFLYLLPCAYRLHWSKGGSFPTDCRVCHTHAHLVRNREKRDLSSCIKHLFAHTKIIISNKKKCDDDNNIDYI